jgi:hypothetical protein
VAFDLEVLLRWNYVVIVLQDEMCYDVYPFLCAVIFGGGKLHE